MRSSVGATFFAAALMTVCACSGSSSESPWPVEPAVSPLGPEGEQPNEELPARRAKRRPIDDEAYGGSGGGRATPAKPVNLEESGAAP
ncbi:MAG: hypothetical protein FJ095_05050 [Deltaproteobacteria bacterium]|nr:hypothetical protein [Deltaproteobacteria bacterium]